MNKIIVSRLLLKEEICRRVINTDHHNVRENGLRKRLDRIYLNPQ